jgi:FtsH-binding integral membrane protein
VKTPPFGLILVAAFAVGTGINGFYTGAKDLPDAPNALAIVVSLFSLLMGIAGLAAAVLLWRQDRRAQILVAVWGGAMIGAATLAPRAYAPEDAGWPAAITGGIMTGAVVVAIVVYTRWRLGLTARGESSPAS